MKYCIVYHGLIDRSKAAGLSTVAWKIGVICRDEACAETNMSCRLTRHFTQVVNVSQ